MVNFEKKNSYVPANRKCLDSWHASASASASIQPEKRDLESESNTEQMDSNYIDVSDRNT